MIGIVGIVIIFIMVFGGYLLAGGKMGIIIKALPFEMMMIGGAALGAFLLSNSGAAAKHAAGDVAKVFKGPKWQAEDYRDLLVLLFELIRLARQNPVGLEEHIEGPRKLLDLQFLSKDSRRSRGCRSHLRHPALGVDELQRSASGRGSP